VEGNLPFTRVFVQEGDAKIAIGAGEGSWRYLFDSSDRWLGMQEFEVPNVVEEYVKEIAPARTFAFEEEMEMIRRAGLGKGLDESSAFVIGTQRYLNDTRFPDEPARHKLLDAIGDLYLAGIPIKHLNVVAERTGHKANVRAAMLLVQECSSAS
jgi:UDP-3-O-acyl-N-acetylglucosamine deacetylase